MHVYPYRLFVSAVCIKSITTDQTSVRVIIRGSLKQFFIKILSDSGRPER
jgi:hypothetical protein